MKSIVFYHHPAPSNLADYDAVRVPGGTVLVRAEIVEGDVDHALATAVERDVPMTYDPPNMFVAVCMCCGSQGAPAITRGAALVMWDERREPGDTKAFCELADRLAGKS